MGKEPMMCSEEVSSQYLRASLSNEKLDVKVRDCFVQQLDATRCTGMTPTAAGADDARDNQPLLSTYVDGDAVEPMSERTLEHSRIAGRSGRNSTRDRDTTFLPPSRPPAGVSNSASITNHADAQPRQQLSIHDIANRRRHRLALVWSYAPDWFVLFCSSPLSLFGVGIGNR